MYEEEAPRAGWLLLAGSYSSPDPKPMACAFVSVDRIPSVLRACTRMLMAAAGRLGLLLLIVLWTMVTVVLPASGEGGWKQSRLGTEAAVMEEERCTVERRAHLTYSEFMQHYAFLKPVILQGLTDNSKFRALCSRENLLASFGDNVVRLSTANTYSYQKVDLPFQEYVEQLLHPQDPESLGNDTLYFFGDNNFTEWAPLFQHYRPPPFHLLGTTPAYSFGIAGAGSGVPFHWHGPGFSEVIYGRKRWFLYPPEKTPEFHPNKTTLAWLLEIYPSLAPSARPLECTIQAGEALYFPDRWWHATLNLDTSVFISTFLG